MYCASPCTRHGGNEDSIVVGRVWLLMGIAVAVMRWLVEYDKTTYVCSVLRIVFFDGIKLAVARWIVESMERDVDGQCPCKLLL